MNFVFIYKNFRLWGLRWVNDPRANTRHDSYHPPTMDLGGRVTFDLNSNLWFNKFAKACVINILLVFHQGQTQSIIVEPLLRLTCPHQLEVCIVILLLYVLFLIWSILNTTCVMVERTQKFNLLIDCSFEFVNFDLNSILWFKNFAKACVMNI